MNWRKLGCVFFEHDPKLVKAEYQGGRYMATYRCDCGKERRFDETDIRIPYTLVRANFNKRSWEK
jgi:hypothetical protein